MTPYHRIWPHLNIKKGGWLDDVCGERKFYVCQRNLCFSGRCNNGSCIAMATNYACRCRPGYVGSHCEIDLCASMPCLNGGTCNKVTNNFTCSCSPGFIGSKCETERYYDAGNGCVVHINKVASQVKSYENAKMKCNSLHAGLAIVKSKQSQTFLNQHHQHWMNANPLWLGGKQINSSWRWLDGSNIVGAPVSMLHDGCLSTTINGSWLVENCTRRIGYACEKLVGGGKLCSPYKCGNGGNCTESGCNFYCSCSPGFGGSVCEISFQQNSGMNVVVYVIPAVVVVVLICFAVLGIFIKRRRNKDSETIEEFVPDLNDEHPYQEVDFSHEAVYANVINEGQDDKCRSVQVSKLTSMLKGLFKDGSKNSLSKEFQELTENSERFETSVASLPENKPRNRFKNILPYDRTRVVLSDQDGCSEYINASYIDCYKDIKKYIATQGPLPKTEEDFWRMIWEVGSTIIVMLTNPIENGKKKCHKYWPDCNKDKCFTSMHVTCTSDETFGCFIKRTFQVNCFDESRVITQFHYTTWPDHSVPHVTSGLHRFKQAVLDEHADGNQPIVVHCSAGVGRTGTFIAFDSLCMEMKESSTINVYETVLSLRKQRMEMVQTQKQYKLLYKLSAEVHVLGSSDTLLMNIEAKVKELERKDGKKSGFALELQKLESLQFEEHQREYALENNDNNTIVPYDHSRITPGVIGSASYYNASYIEGYGQNELQFIAAKGPTKQTKENFWSALLSNEVNTIVSLRTIDEENNNRWFPTLESPRLKYCDVTINLLEEVETGSDVIERKLEICQGKSLKLEIDFYQLISWSVDTVPNNAGDVIQLIKKIQESRNEKKGKVAVYCSDGGSRTGALLCVLNLMERAKVEGKVDVVREVNDIRSMRRGMVCSELLYRYIYYCMVEFAASFSAYANFKG
ncbi:receptor-type tyrosine-protein phosphatase epsilon-like isoform X2 [Ciona intestinalis]